MASHLHVYFGVFFLYFSSSSSTENAVSVAKTGTGGCGQVLMSLFLIVNYNFLEYIQIQEL